MSEFWRCLRHYWSPEQIADRMDRFVLNVHRPQDPFGDGSLILCWRCNKEWPCATWLKIDRRRSAREGRHSCA